MYSGDTLLETASLKVALEDFLMFLEQQGDKIILVAHNGFRYLTFNCKLINVSIHVKIIFIRTQQV